MGQRRHHSASPPHPTPATIGLQLSSLAASLSLWGAGESAMGSMWQEVGTMTHGVGLHPPFWRLG